MCTISKELYSKYIYSLKIPPQKCYVQPLAIILPTDFLY